MQALEIKKEAVEFQMGDLIPIAVTLAVAGLVVAFSLQVLGDVKSDMTADSAEANATQDTIEGLAEIPSKFGILATVAVAAVVIGVLVSYFLGRLSQ